MSKRSLSVQVVRELSAVASRPPPRSIRRLAPELAAEAKRVADVGCGYLVGTRELLKYHDHVYAVDTAFQATRIHRQLSALAGQATFAGFRTAEAFEKSKLRLGGAYVVNVLHTLPSAEERTGLLAAVARNLRAHGFAVLDVPSYEHYYSQRMTAENAYGDGYLFSRGSGRATFYRFTSASELDAWAEAASLSFDFSIRDNHHLVRVYRR